ncbi:MAG: ribonuclease III [Rectinemataceae bacterium]
MRAERLDALLRFQEKAQLSFHDISLLDRAFTHRSRANETIGQSSNNETLEFLGDAVLGQAVAHMLFRALDGRPEGELAQIKSWVVSEASLAPLAEDMGIPEILLLGRGEENSGGRRKKAILADAMEALFGALFIDSGHEAAAAFVERTMESRLREALAGGRRDYKTALQEFAQKHKKSLPFYKLENTEGPEHERVFEVSCDLGEGFFARAKGKTKKDAEQAAARALYEAILASGGVDDSWPVQ